MKTKLSSLLRLSVKLVGISNVLEVLESSFKGTLSARLHDLHHLQESILKAKQVWSLNVIDCSMSTLYILCCLNVFVTL